MIYGGVKYYKVRHALYCKKCFVTIESIGSLVCCSCGAIGVDEGRILGNLEDMEDRSMYVATIRGKRVWLPESILYAQFIHVKARGAGGQHVPPNGYRSPTTRPPDRVETVQTYHANPVRSTAQDVQDDQSAHSSEHNQCT